MGIRVCDLKSEFISHTSYSTGDDLIKTIVYNKSSKQRPRPEKENFLRKKSRRRNVPFSGCGFFLKFFLKLRFSTTKSIVNRLVKRF